MAIILVAAILIASISTCSVSKNVDPHYKGDRTILSSFDAVRVDYPDTEMADRIAGLAAEEQQENLDIAYSCITL